MEQKRTIEDVKREIEEAKDKLHKLYEEEVDFEHEELNLNFEGQYIEYKNHVMFVEDIIRDRLRFQNFDFCYLIRGLGFYSIMTGYNDATECDWSYWHELYIYGNTKSEFEKKIGDIKIITKEEYEKRFDEMVLNMIENNKKAISFYENMEKED